eukprot:CAMPEP_0180334132 /NCGR_PEP_ID=MMETSP0988-20121125/43501_1 /TAXON_ID=697907 /ORGANISM="non described non described, Strain CCMP2293" /LENGTH=110 /DNA_ID=CAMNT_0022322021 /DNA_START=87 /DNA_END=416 /DNA_ORIENTATION=-
MQSQMVEIQNMVWNAAASPRLPSLQALGTTDPSDHAHPRRNHAVWNSASRYSTHQAATPRVRPVIRTIMLKVGSPRAVTASTLSHITTIPYSPTNGFTPTPPATPSTPVQ